MSQLMISLLWKGLMMALMKADLTRMDKDCSEHYTFCDIQSSYTMKIYEFSWCLNKLYWEVFPFKRTLCVCLYLFFEQFTLTLKPLE